MKKIYLKTLISCFVVLMAIIAGCNEQMEKGTATALGTGLGDIAAQAMRNDTDSVLNGLGVGQSGGYIIGDAEDKKLAQTYNYNEPTLLTGSEWKVLAVVTRSGGQYESMNVDFMPGGKVITTRFRGGKKFVFQDRYRIVGDDTIILYGPDYIVNAKFDYYTSEMVIDAKDFRVVLRRASVKL